VPLALRIGTHVVQLRRYEAGSFRPTRDVIRQLATVLRASAELLRFCKDEEVRRWQTVSDGADKK